MRSNSQKQAKVFDPVCGMRVDPQEAVASTCYGGQKFYFCAAGCKHAFESDPENFLKNKTKRKGIWQRYLDRLNKATSGQPPACH